MQIIKNIGTHNGAFHVDEVLACCMLIKYTNQFKGGQVTRSRDPQIWEKQDVLVDVGGIYDPNTHRYDHHQKEFQETFSKDFSTRLSSAGLIFKHFGKEVLQNIFKQIHDSVDLSIEIPQIDEISMNTMYQKLYKGFIQSIDAIDNGISQYPKQDDQRYVIKTDLSSVIHRLNPLWCEKNQDENQKFHEAIEVVNNELIQQVKAIYLGWFSGRKIVENAFNERFQYEENGQIVKLSMALPWKSHIYDLEEEQSVQNKIKFVLYPDRTEGWRVQAVSKSEGSFENRVSLKNEWRGIKDIQQLKTISGIDDIVFVHASGFIGGARSFENTLKMAKLSLD